MELQGMELGLIGEPTLGMQLHRRLWALPILDDLWALLWLDCGRNERKMKG